MHGWARSSFVGTVEGFPLREWAASRDSIASDGKRCFARYPPLCAGKCSLDVLFPPSRQPQMCFCMGCTATTQHTRIARFRFARFARTFPAHFLCGLVRGGGVRAYTGCCWRKWRGPSCVLAQWCWIGSSPGAKDTSRGKSNMCLRLETQCSLP